MNADMDRQWINREVHKIPACWPFPMSPVSVLSIHLMYDCLRNRSSGALNCSGSSAEYPASLTDEESGVNVEVDEDERIEFGSMGWSAGVLRGPS